MIGYTSIQTSSGRSPVACSRGGWVSCVAGAAPTSVATRSPHGHTQQVAFHAHVTQAVLQPVSDERALLVVLAGPDAYLCAVGGTAPVRPLPLSGGAGPPVQHLAPVLDLSPPHPSTAEPCPLFALLHECEDGRGGGTRATRLLTITGVDVGAAVVRVPLPQPHRPRAMAAARVGGTLVLAVAFSSAIHVLLFSYAGDGRVKLVSGDGAGGSGGALLRVKGDVRCLAFAGTAGGPGASLHLLVTTDAPVSLLSPGQGSGVGGGVPGAPPLLTVGRTVRVTASEGGPLGSSTQGAAARLPPPVFVSEGLNEVVAQHKLRGEASRTRSGQGTGEHPSERSLLDLSAEVDRSLAASRAIASGGRVLEVEVEEVSTFSRADGSQAASILSLRPEAGSVLGQLLNIGGEGWRAGAAHPSFSGMTSASAGAPPAAVAGARPSFSAFLLRLPSGGETTVVVAAESHAPLHSLPLAARCVDILATHALGKGYGVAVALGSSSKGSHGRVLQYTLTREDEGVPSPTLRLTEVSADGAVVSGGSAALVAQPDVVLSGWYRTEAAGDLKGTLWLELLGGIPVPHQAGAGVEGEQGEEGRTGGGHDPLFVNTHAQPRGYSVVLCDAVRGPRVGIMEEGGGGASRGGRGQGQGVAHMRTDHPAMVAYSVAEVEALVPPPSPFSPVRAAGQAGWPARGGEGEGAAAEGERGHASTAAREGQHSQRHVYGAPAPSPPVVDRPRPAPVPSPPSSLLPQLGGGGGGGGRGHLSPRPLTTTPHSAHFPAESGWSARRGGPPQSYTGTSTPAHALSFDSVLVEGGGQRYYAGVRDYAVSTTGVLGGGGRAGAPIRPLALGVAGGAGSRPSTLHSSTPHPPSHPVAHAWHRETSAPSAHHLRSPYTDPSPTSTVSHRAGGGGDTGGGFVRQVGYTPAQSPPQATQRSTPHPPPAPLAPSPAPPPPSSSSALRLSLLAEAAGVRATAQAQAGRALVLAAQALERAEEEGEGGEGGPVAAVAQRAVDHARLALRLTADGQG